MQKKNSDRTLCVIFNDPSGGLHAQEIVWGSGKIDVDKLTKIVSLHSCLNKINILAVIDKLPIT